MPTNPVHLRPQEMSSREVLRAFAHRKRRKRAEVFCFQVGANDGRINDPVWPYLTRFGWAGLLVEPLVDVFEGPLEATYAAFPKIKLVNVAIAPTEGTLSLYRVAISRARWATGLTSFLRRSIEDHIENGYIARKAAEEGVVMPDDPADIIETTDVSTMSVEALLDREGVQAFDVLCIDTEGFDFEVLKLVDLERFRPELILFESKNLPDPVYILAKAQLEDAGYRLFWDNGDTFATLPNTDADRASQWVASLNGRFAIAARHRLRRLLGKG